MSVNWTPGSGPTEGSDTFDGFNSNDALSIEGLGGDDSLLGGLGDDTLSGDAGNDTLAGYFGDNSLDGGDGLDVADYRRLPFLGAKVDLTGATIDGVFTDGFAGIEGAIGTAGADTLDFSANAGASSLSGYVGNDILLGGAGGGAGDGGDGNDRVDFSSSAAATTLIGGQGNDTLLGGLGGGAADGGDGSDSIDFSSSTATVTLVGGLGNDTLLGGLGGGAADGGDGNDLIDFLPGAAAVALTGGLGDDTLRAGVGGVSGDGGDGNDSIDFSSSTTNVTLSGGVGDDSLLGGIGNDYLVAGSGNDLLVAGGGVNTADFSGKAADDPLYVTEGGGSVGSATLSGNFQALLGGQGNDTLDFGSAGFDVTLIGNAGDDLLIAGSGDSRLVGGLGSDTLDGTRGNATADYSGNGPAPLFPLSVDVEGGEDGQGGIDRFVGINFVVGGYGDDTIDFSAATGSVTLMGGAGFDSLVGGSGDDLLRFGFLPGSPDDFDLGTGTVVGGDGRDTADFTSEAYSDFPRQLRLDVNGGEFLSMIGWVPAIEFDGIEAVLAGGLSDTVDFSGATFGAALAGNAGDDSLVGGDFGDSLVGGTGADTLAGGLGNDTLVAGNTNDLVQGGAGNDALSISGGGNTVQAGDDDDVIRGSLGNGDTIDGGNGADTLAFSQAGYYSLTATGDGSYAVAFLGADTITAEATGSFTDVEAFAHRGGLFNPGALGTGNSTLLAVCFAEGTGILTDRGEVPVEDLSAGDVVATLGLRGPPRARVLWVGRRRIMLAGHPQRAALAPVRIRAGALGEDAPIRDLLVSPDHCLFLDGALVPARLLVNGETIVTERGRSEVSYFHVELDRHDVLIAEGAAAESWLDAGNRAWFANAPAALLRVDGMPDAHAVASVEPCAPVLHGGAGLAAIRDGIELRAARMRAAGAA